MQTYNQFVLGECELWQETTTRPTATGRHLHVQRLRFYRCNEVGFASAVGHKQAKQLVHRRHEHALSHGFGEQMGSGHQDGAIRSYGNDLLSNRNIRVKKHHNDVKSYFDVLMWYESLLYGPPNEGQHPLVIIIIIITGYTLSMNAE